MCISSLRAYSPLTAFIAGTAGSIAVPGSFWTPSGFTHTRYSGLGATGAEEFTYEREGAGYVPMLRAVSQSVLDGEAEHPLRTHAETIAVAETMDAVLAQVLA